MFWIKIFWRRINLCGHFNPSLIVQENTLVLSSLCQALDDISWHFGIWIKCSFPPLVFSLLHCLLACAAQTLWCLLNTLKNASVILSTFLFHTLIQGSLENGHYVTKMKFKRNSEHFMLNNMKEGLFSIHFGQNFVLQKFDFQSARNWKPCVWGGLNLSGQIKFLVFASYRVFS